MSRILELHVLQQFAPGNLNRDDTGAPKDAMFGGVRRARISSQSFKRAVRRHFQQSRLLDDNELADRSKRLVTKLQGLLEGKVPDPAKAAVGLLEQAGLKLKKLNEVPVTEYLLFIGHSDLQRLADLATAHGGDVSGKEAKKQVESIMRSNRAVDVALFGRMLADAKDFNVDAAAQVAHAISTHRVDREFDFFTAVDDLAPADEAVSGMLGTVDFNSACYYRYAVVNLDLLRRNLGEDAGLAKRAVDAFIEAFVRAIPSGKQNTFAAHNPPEFVAVRLRDGGAINLSGAFEKPVASRHGYLATSVTALEQHWSRLDKAYGGAGQGWVLDLSAAWTGEQVDSLDGLRAKVQDAIG